MLAGLVALPFAVGVDAGRSRWSGRFGAVSEGVALALYGVLQAVDAVGNKEVDDAWVNAPNAEKAARSRVLRQCAGWSSGGLSRTPVM
jgi:hypothetical protein